METTKSFSPSGLDELVFMNRNKAYGAYELRKNYEKRLRVAAISPLIACVLLFLILNNLPNHKQSAFIPVIPKKTDSSVIFRPQTNVVIEGMQQRAIKREGLGRIVLTNGHARTDTNRIDHINGSEGKIGTLAGTDNGLGEDGLGLEGTGRMVAPVETKKSYELFPDQNAEFPGGAGELENYLHKNIKYPTFAVDNNIAGLIYLSIKIDETGKIDDVTVLKGIGGGCDEAAITAVKRMPRWRPGRKNGEYIPVVCNIKVRMILN